MLLMMMMLTSSCALSNQNKLNLNPFSDFCSRYHEIIIEKGDSEIQAKSSVKKRIAANDIDYKCNCLKIKADYCKLGNL